ncbi:MULTISPECIES: helix-turn-helix domain-containing protein [Brevibacterium]|uniref:GAF domain-containing protein n=1 Tax=Brevibacterium salitolerans TaxID=1403566 RepID=A0ABP5I4A1_9MICO|nr:helix-turn-helix domain-containing protein [Brevibacterium sp.]
MTDLNRYLEALLVANDPTQAMQAAVHQVRRTFGCDVSWTGLVEDGCLRMGTASGLRTPEMSAVWRLEVGSGIGGRAALLGRPHKSSDYQHDARRVPAKRVIDNEGIVTVLVVPLLSADRTLGVLYAACRRPRAWADEDVGQLETIGRYLAVRLEQLDVDGRAEAEARSHRERADAASAALRSAADLAHGLMGADRIEEAVQTASTALDVRIELRDEGGRLLHSGGRQGGRTLLSGELEPGGSLRLALLSADAHRSADEPALRLAYEVLRSQLLRLGERERTTERLRGDLFDQLVTGRLADGEGLVRRLALIGMSGLARGARVLVAGSRGPGGQVSARFAEEFRTTFTRSLLQRRGDRLAALVELPTAPEGRTRQQLAELLARERLRSPGAGAVIGIGRACGGLGDISMSYDEARAACEVGLSGDHHSEDGVVSARNLGLQGLASLPLAQLETTVADTLGPLRELDEQRGTQHLATARAYLGNDRHLPRTAAELRVHYNTVRNRVAQIERLLGVDFDDVDDRFRIETALRMESVVRALSHRPAGTVMP